MACLFCEIAAGEREAWQVYGDELVVAFLDVCPIRPGHVQIIPRNHYAFFDNVPDNVLNRIGLVAKRLAASLKQVTGVERVAFLFTGGDIPHAHAHLVPMVEKTDITSRQYIAEQELTFASTPRANSDELSSMAQQIARAFVADGL